MLACTVAAVISSIKMAVLPRMGNNTAVHFVDRARCDAGDIEPLHTLGVLLWPMQADASYTFVMVPPAPPRALRITPLLTLRRRRHGARTAAATGTT